MVSKQQPMHFPEQHLTLHHFMQKSVISRILSDEESGLAIIGCGHALASSALLSSMASMTPVSTPIIMATILQSCNRGRSHSFLNYQRLEINKISPKIMAYTGRNILEEITSHYGKHSVQRRGRKGFK